MAVGVVDGPERAASMRRRISSGPHVVVVGVGVGVVAVVAGNVGGVGGGSECSDGKTCLKRLMRHFRASALGVAMKKSACRMLVLSCLLNLTCVVERKALTRVRAFWQLQDVLCLNE